MTTFYNRVVLAGEAGYNVVMNKVGTQDEAFAVYLHHNAMWDEQYGPLITLAGQGEDRCAWRIGNTVYKVGKRASANRYDHATGTEARRRGYRWAPPASTLHEIPDRWGGTTPVLAMPYLESDGSDPDPVLEAEMHAQAGPNRHGIAVDGSNYVVIARQPIVIDCCSVSLPRMEGDSR